MALANLGEVNNHWDSLPNIQIFPKGLKQLHACTHSHSYSICGQAFIFTWCVHVLCISIWKHEISRHAGQDYPVPNSNGQLVHTCILFAYCYFTKAVFMFDLWQHFELYAGFNVNSFVVDKRINTVTSQYQWTLVRSRAQRDPQYVCMVVNVLTCPIL